MKKKIILEGEFKFEDGELREYMDKLWQKVETINERTKRQTRQIQELQALHKKNIKYNEKEKTKK